jgi:predicted alpha/beta-hydrolase family hydrolase
MDSPFLEGVTAGVTAGAPAISVGRFEFPYMAARRLEGKRGPPDREPVLLDAWRAAIEAAESAGFERGAIYIGGKSMGGRMASLVADESRVAGLVCLGYPFHPPGRPEKTRTAHLARLATPALICQGERDPFGTVEDVAGYELAPSIEIFWCRDGNHDLKPRKASGATHEGNLASAVERIREFVTRGS